MEEKKYYSPNRSEDFNEFWEMLKDGQIIPEKEYNVPFPKNWKGEHYLLLTNQSIEVCARVGKSKNGKLFWKSLPKNTKVETSKIASWKKLTEKELTAYKKDLEDLEKYKLREKFPFLLDDNSHSM